MLVLIIRYASSNVALSFVVTQHTLGALAEDVARHGIDKRLKVFWLVLNILLLVVILGVFMASKGVLMTSGEICKERLDAKILSYHRLCFFQSQNGFCINSS
jgi:hypothetical protein